MIGRTIGKYRIEGQIGRGRTGLVYRAIDVSLDRDVAIRTLSPDLASTEVMKRFRAEATILARLGHPQIATIHELVAFERGLLLVTELVRGRPLDCLSERSGPLTPERAAYLIELILPALAHAHRAGVVHRDIRPANVMVTDEGGVRVIDFGIARVLGAGPETVDFRLMGTPAYMSPEQVMGEEADPRSDLYAVGVLFYGLLTGALPFSADTALAMLQCHVRDRPLPLDTHRRGLPDWCSEVVQRALAKAPADRYQSAEEFRHALLRATGPLPMNELARTFVPPAGERLAPRVSSISGEALVARMQAHEPTVVDPGGARRRNRPRLAYTTAAAIALSALAGGAVATGIGALTGGTGAAPPEGVSVSSPTSAPPRLPASDGSSAVPAPSAEVESAPPRREATAAGPSLVLDTD